MEKVSQMIKTIDKYNIDNDQLEYGFSVSFHCPGPGPSVMVVIKNMNDLQLLNYKLNTLMFYLLEQMMILMHRQHFPEKY